jgi:opacity protein-like surface antigen
VHLKDIHRRALCGFAGLLIAGMLGSTAQAQPKFYPRVEIMAAGGANFPLNQFNENADVGYLVSLQAGWRVGPGSTIGLSMMRARHNASGKYREANMIPATSTAEFVLWYGSVYFKQSAFESVLRPYMRIHLGGVDVDANVDGSDDAAADVRFAMSGGFGLQWKDRWPLGVYSEVLYHQAIIREEDPNTESDRRQFITWRLGLSYDFM